MNDRIYDMALEVFKDQPNLESWTFTDAELQQFVTLIVKDCADMVKDAHKSGGGTYLHVLYERYGIEYPWAK